MSNFYKLSEEDTKELLELFNSIPTPSINDRLDMIFYNNSIKAWVIHLKGLTIKGTGNYFFYESWKSYSSKSFVVEAFVDTENKINYKIAKILEGIATDKDYSLSMNEVDTKNLLKDLIVKIKELYKKNSESNIFNEDSSEMSNFLRKKLKLF